MQDSEANAAREREITQNYEAFLKKLPGLLAHHRGKFALMRHREVIGIYSILGDAVREGIRRYENVPFSVQEITDELVELVQYPVENVVPPAQSVADARRAEETVLSPVAEEVSRLPRDPS